MESFNFRYWKSNLPSIGIVAALIALTIIAAISLISINEFQNRARWVNHTNRLIAELEETFSLLTDAQSSARGYVIAGKPEFLTPFNTAKQKLPIQIELLRTLTKDNLYQQKNVDVLQVMLDEQFVRMSETIHLRESNVDPAVSFSFVTTGIGLRFTERTRAHISMMQDQESKLLIEREHRTESSVRNAKALILFGTVAAYLMICGAFWLLRNEIRQRQLTDRSLLESNNALLRHASELEITNKELESFSYSISHDLRIPLRAVAGYARMLEEDYADKLDTEGQRLLDVIRDNSKRMGVLIDDLLAFSKLGRQAISATEVDMSAIAQSVAEEMQRKEDYLSARFVIDVMPTAWADRSLMKQVWVNLISNALKYSSTRDQPVIRISGEKKGAETIFTIADNGVGFDMQYYDKMFGVFQRLHSAEEFPGTGVGLAIVQRIIVRHGGRLWAEGKINEGASFSFTLPMKEDHYG